MKSTRNELRAKINSIIEELDLLELTKEPTFKTLEEVVTHLKENKIGEIDREDSEGQHYHGIIIRASGELFKCLQDYNTEIFNRGSEWKRKAETLVSKLLADETGISQNDMDFIKKPLCFYGHVVYDIDQLADFLKVFGIGIFVTYKDKYVPIEKLRYEYKNTDCESISRFYRRSLEDITDIFGMEVSLSDHMKFGDEAFKQIILPSITDIDIKLKEKEIEKLKEESYERVRKYAEVEIEQDKEDIVRNIEMIDSIYGIIRKENNSVRESFEKQMDAAFAKRKGLF